MECLDGFCMNILHEKEYNGCTFYKCTYFPKSDITYIVKKREMYGTWRNAPRCNE